MDRKRWLLISPPLLDELSMARAALAFGFIVAFFATEALLQKGSAAKSLDVTESDKRSTLLVSAAIGVALVIPPSFNLFRIGRITMLELAWRGVCGHSRQVHANGHLQPRGLKVCGF